MLLAFGSGGISVGEIGLVETTVGDADDREAFTVDDGVGIPSGASKTPCSGDINDTFPTLVGV